MLVEILLVAILALLIYVAYVVTTNSSNTTESLKQLIAKCTGQSVALGCISERLNCGEEVFNRLAMLVQDDEEMNEEEVT